MLIANLNLWYKIALQPSFFRRIAFEAMKLLVFLLLMLVTVATCLAEISEPNVRAQLEPASVETKAASIVGVPDYINNRYICGKWPRWCPIVVNLV